MTVGTWPVIQQPSTLVRGAPGEELAGGDPVVGKTSGRPEPTAITRGSPTVNCSSYAPGHHVHSTQVGTSEPGVPVIVEALTPSDSGLPQLQQRFSILPGPETKITDASQPDGLRIFVVHDADRLRTLIAAPHAVATYAETNHLLRVSYGNDGDTEWFNVCVGAAKPCSPSTAAGARQADTGEDEATPVGFQFGRDCDQPLTENRVLRASGWLWTITLQRIVGVCPDCGSGVQILHHDNSARAVQYADEAEALHGCPDRVVAPTILTDLYGIRRIARRWGFPAELLPEEESA